MLQTKNYTKVKKTMNAVSCFKIALKVKEHNILRHRVITRVTLLRASYNTEVSAVV